LGGGLFFNETKRQRRARLHGDGKLFNKLLRPTPFDKPIQLKARVVESTKDRATVEAELIADDKVCATCKGLFVAVKEGHPAYHRW
jgi:predicted transcriptional regulator